MASKDPSPHFGEIMQPPNRTIPQPKPGEEDDEPVHGNPGADRAADEPKIPERPPLPTHPERMAADVEDEEADPVNDSGRGIPDGVMEPEEGERLSNMDPDVPAPEPVPPINNPDPQPGDPKPKAPPSEDEEPGRRHVPVELPGKPGVPERVG